MKTDPLLESRINDVIYHIHRDISAEHSARSLAQVALYSEAHFHRVFKTVMGEPVHHYVRRVKLEYAANLLMFDRHTPLWDIATKVGFQSVSSFSRAFLKSFGVRPGNWRWQGPNQFSRPPYLLNEEIAAAYARLAKRPLPELTMTELPPRRVAYVRHQGYDRGIRQAWQFLRAWALAEGRPIEQQYGLHHSNPAWTSLEECRYVACIGIDKPLSRRGRISELTIPGGLHGVFHIRGRYGELLPNICKIIEQWLPHSGFKLQTTPAYVQYFRNQFVEPDERFELDFCLPLSFY